MRLNWVIQTLVRTSTYYLTEVVQTEVGNEFS